MYSLLSDLRIIEASSFVASPSAGLYLAQLGATVIRVDPIGGGPDFRRWPKSREGASFYWEGLNKAKKSVAIDLARPEGRELLERLAAAPGENAGLLLTNYPFDGFLSYERLKALRPDIVIARIMGRPDGGSALDYTVNCALGLPMLTGPAFLKEPVNHVLPAWDLLTGALAAFALLAAERRRRETGEGSEARIPLSDVGIATLANLGMLAEVLCEGRDRPRYGNDVFGAFGRDFVTADGKRLMIVALTAKQWRALVDTLGMSAEVARIEAERGVSFAIDEGERFMHRDALVPLVADRVAKRRAAELVDALQKAGGCVGLYQTLAEAAKDRMLVSDNPIFAEAMGPSGFAAPTPGSPITFAGEVRERPAPAVRLGAHTEEVLADVLQLGASEIAALFDQKIVAGAHG